jgi:hypothetical protein
VANQTSSNSERHTDENVCRNGFLVPQSDPCRTRFFTRECQDESERHIFEPVMIRLITNDLSTVTVVWRDNRRAAINFSWASSLGKGRRTRTEQRQTSPISDRTQTIDERTANAFDFHCDVRLCRRATCRHRSLRRVDEATPSDCS